MDQKPPIYLFTDGAASGNPGPGGYGIVLRCGSYEKELSGGFARTTNNRMELLAVIIGLEQINAVYARHRVAFHWIKGHAGHPENERCDRLAVAAYHGTGLPEDTGYIEETQLI